MIKNYVERLETDAVTWLWFSFGKQNSTGGIKCDSGIAYCFPLVAMLAFWVAAPQIMMKAEKWKATNFRKKFLCQNDEKLAP